ncbi:phage terminase large subunit family protein [Weeksellaceae bacterium TAE3-ERU29]|nr:phage terminase large subunit family protein [Weeksellaceae bacterium TAE3-ERU29]
MGTHRFKDQNWVLGHFTKKILVHCPKCQEKAEIKNPGFGKTSELFCSHCGLHQKDNRIYYDLYLNIHCPDCGNPINLEHKGIREKKETIRVSCPNCDFVGDYKPKYIKYSYSSAFVDTELWLEKDFKGELFFACNYEHLEYLKQYIQAKIRERKDGTYMTMVEKLPQFIKSAKNREGLLKLIKQLEEK